MAESNVQICNMALSHIGSKSTIESLQEQSAAAQQCRLWYELARKQTLGAYNWTFARKRLALALHEDPAPTGLWNFRYQYPSDCLKAREIENLAGPDADAIKYEIETGNGGVNKSILCDVEQARLIYTFDAKIVQMYTDSFAQAMSRLLASQIAMSLTGKQDLQQSNLNLFFQWLRFAEAEDANEHVDKKPRDAEWIQGRL